MSDFELEWSAPSDIYADFRVLRYKPTGPTLGRLRSVNLLRASFASFGLLNEGNELIDRMRAAFGLFETGWGFKMSSTGPSWELYWYHERREPRSKSIASLAAALVDFGGLRVHTDQNWPYASFSLDVSEALLRARHGVDGLNLYFGEGVDSRCPGLSCRATSSECLLCNTYYVAATSDEASVQELAKRVLYSPRCGSIEATSVLLDARPRPCKYIYFANKPDCDGIYYSHVDLSCFVEFLATMHYPLNFVQFVDSHRERLDHLDWDIGFNYVVVDHQVLRSKGGVYGYF